MLLNIPRDKVDANNCFSIIKRKNIKFYHNCCYHFLWRWCCGKKQIKMWFIMVYLTNQMWFNVVYSLIDNDTRLVSPQQILTTFDLFFTTISKKRNLCLDNWKHRLGFESARAALCKWLACSRLSLKAKKKGEREKKWGRSKARKEGREPVRISFTTLFRPPVV